jgi:hypothetical protein
VDTNGDGKIDNFTDTDADGLSDNVDGYISAATGKGLGLPDFDADGVPNYLDLDSDNDGIPDILEAGAPDANNDDMVDGFTDVNKDGLHDAYINATALLKTGADTDADGKANSYPNKNNDTDFRPNAYDLDSDNDGIPDVVEAYGVDTNGDGKIDNFTDTDADGLSDNVDGYISAATGKGLGLPDFDADGVPNYLDLDSDNDGIPDILEAGAPDANNDDKVDGFTDVNNDGLHDAYINATALLKTGADTDADGKANSYPNKNNDTDFRPNAYDLDSDNDGIPDVVEAYGVDTNGDGKIDNFTDTDADGLSDNVDGYVSAATGKGLGNIDMDTDGVPNFIDLDSDNDGIPDILEAAAPDANNDGVVDVFADANGNGFADAYEGAVNAILKTGADVNADGKADSYPNKNNDTDLKPNPYDLDSDNDGIPDVVEAYGVDTNGDGKIDNFTDTDADGLSDNVDGYISAATGKGLGLPDFDADGVPNYLDLDSDNDGIPDILEAGAPDANNDDKVDGFTDVNNDGLHDAYINATALLKTGADTDADGKANSYPNKNNDTDFRPNAYDLDSDNDGIPDVVEAYGVDTNGDGKIDNFTDTDADGLSDNVDGYVSAATGKGLGNIDMDTDGVPNFIDLDSDNDGIPDIVETGAPDTNNNGVVDVFADANGNGFADAYEGAVNAILKTGADVNNDGKADSYPNKNKDNDFRPNAYDMDSDGDGIIDLTESGFPDNVAPFSIVDGVIGTNGWSATVSGMAALNLRITDADIYPDYLDIDADNDGIPDNIEGQPTATYKMPGTVDTDSDGLVDTYETAGTIAVFGGTGIGFYDNGGSPLPDYRDLDSDGDGQADIIEGNDFNLNGFADDLVTLTGLDTDGDGLDNRFDSLNSVTNLKGTSYRMGLNGSLTGDATPGARCPVQKKVPAQLDRDWRYISSVLPVQFLNFTANTQNTKVLLSWAIQTAAAIDYVEVERSLNNSSFITAGIVTDVVKLNEPQSFGFTDDISAVNSDVIYYRLKVIAKSGEIKYSNVLLVRKNQTKTPLSIAPNPAHDYVSIKFVAEKACTVTIRLVDNTGKTVLQHNQLASKGNNSIQLNNLEKYSSGVYSLQVLINNEIVTQKLILSK